MRIKDFLMEEDGVGVVEVILILVVLIGLVLGVAIATIYGLLIGLVLIFKKQITELVNSIFKTINKEAGKV